MYHILSSLLPAFSPYHYCLLIWRGCGHNCMASLGKTIFALCLPHTKFTRQLSWFKTLFLLWLRPSHALYMVPAYGFAHHLFFLVLHGYGSVCLQHFCLCLLWILLFSVDLIVYVASMAIVASACSILVISFFMPHGLWVLCLSSHLLVYANCLL